MTTKPIDPVLLRGKLHQDPAEVRRFCEALLEQSGATLPEDYDVEAAFADTLMLGTLVGDIKDAQGPVGRLALWLFRRLPNVAGGG